MTQELDLTQHPCFHQAARRTAARIHLPVRRGCNVQCNFCDRRFDCLNESRPGVTSAVLTPQQAVYYLERAVEKSPAIVWLESRGPAIRSRLRTKRSRRCGWSASATRRCCCAWPAVDWSSRARRRTRETPGESCHAHGERYRPRNRRADLRLGSRRVSSTARVDGAAVLLERQRLAIVELKRHGSRSRSTPLSCPASTASTPPRWPAKWRRWARTS